MSWFSRIVAYHPFFVLIAISVFSITCLIIPFTTLNLPNFKDPQLGFEARGTEIGHRLTAWNNLLEGIRPSGPLTVNPVVPSEIERKKRKKINSKSAGLIDKAVYENSTTNELNSVQQVSVNSSDDVFFVVERRNMTEDSEEEEESVEEDWKDLVWEGHHHGEHSHTSDPTHHHLSPDNYFCSQPSGSYGRVVVSSPSDLFSFDSILSMCLLEASLVSSPEFSGICESISKQRCCRPWSLPNYIAMLYNRTSCLNVTKSDINKTKKLIDDCRHYFYNLDIFPEYKTKDIPFKCRKHNAVFNLLQFILDYDYMNISTPLKNVLIMLPIAQSSAVLPYYKSLDVPALHFNNVSVTAIDFGLKNILFDECLVQDTYLIGVGGFFVFLSMWFYTRSLFLTVMTFIAILFSLSIAYFMYTLIFELKFFPFMNLLASIVAVGVGGDASLMVCKVWWAARADHPHANVGKLVQTAQNHSTRSLIVSSLTTAAAFYSSYISNITAICCFSLFAGSTVLANLFIMIAWVPASLVISQKVTGNRQNPRRTSPQLGKLIFELRYFWFIFFTFITVASLFVIFYHPKLRLPDSSDMQLFKSSHPFERYDIEYKKRFRFERLQRTSEESGLHMPLRFVWGVVPIDNGNFLDPTAKGKLKLDPTFDPAAPDSQEWLLKFCSKIRSQPWYEPTLGPLIPNCFVEPFVSWMERKCVDTIDSLSRAPCCESAKFPYSRRVFSLCLARAARSLYATQALSPFATSAGPKFASPKLNSSKIFLPRLKALVIEYDSNFTFTSSFVEMDLFYKQVESWTKEEMASAPPGLQNGWFISELSLYDLQTSLFKDTFHAVLISTIISFILVAVATRDILLSFYAVLTITSTIVTTVAALVLIGWRLNVLESVAICVAIGLSVDFTIHYVVNYKFYCGNNKRENRMMHSVEVMSGPTFMSCVTSCLAGGFMLPSQVLAYNQIGVFLVVLMPISWFYSTVWLGALLSILGPNGKAPRSSPGVELRPRGPRHRAPQTSNPDHSPSAASATTIIHDDEIIHHDIT